MYRPRTPCAGFFHIDWRVTWSYTVPTMKLTFTVFIGLLLCTLPTQGQGTVWFNNNPSSLVLVNGVPIPPEPETFYFGLFLAPPGTTDRNAFVFTGNYATNASHFPGTTGRFIGGIQPVQGWLPGRPMGCADGSPLPGTIGIPTG